MENNRTVQQTVEQEKRKTAQTRHQSHRLQPAEKMHIRRRHSCSFSTGKEKSRTPEKTLDHRGSVGTVGKTRIRTDVRGSRVRPPEPVPLRVANGGRCEKSLRVYRSSGQPLKRTCRSSGLLPLKRPPGETQANRHRDRHRHRRPAIRHSRRAAEQPERPARSGK